jgi:hypothetical protein
MWRGAAGLDQAIHAYGRALEQDSDHASTRFRLGVAHRKRFDGPNPRPDDFRRAVAHWTAALSLEPNQYIWRRRLQQYGPRLDKPYPFYDWVSEARRELIARGEQPLPLVVEPRGAEVAAPASALDARVDLLVETDPDGRIWRDRGDYVRITSAVVPPRARPGGAARVHLRLTPDLTREIHWNNEAGEHQLWLSPPKGWRVADRRVVVQSAPSATSHEERFIDFEVQSGSGATEVGTLTGYALYYICEGVNGVCMYRRQDFTVPLTVDPEAVPLGDR